MEEDMIQVWLVKWEDGKSQQYCLYDSHGMTSFIKKGLAKGLVTVNDREVYITEEGYWRYKNA